MLAINKYIFEKLKIGKGIKLTPTYDDIEFIIYLPKDRKEGETLKKYPYILCNKSHYVFFLSKDNIREAIDENIEIKDLWCMRFNTNYKDKLQDLLNGKIKFNKYEIESNKGGCFAADNIL